MLALCLQPCCFICSTKKKKILLKLICFEAPSTFGTVARDWCPLWPRKVLLAQTVVGGNNTKHAKEGKDEHRLGHVLLWESVTKPNFNNTGPSNSAAAFIVCQSRLILICRNHTGIPCISVNLIPRCSDGCWLTVVLLQHLSLLATGNTARLNFAQQYRRKTLSLWMVSVRYGTREPPHVLHAALTVSDRYGPQQWGWWDIYRRHSHMADWSAPKL